MVQTKEAEIGKNWSLLFYDDDTKTLGVVLLKKDVDVHFSMGQINNSEMDKATMISLFKDILKLVKRDSNICPQCGCKEINKIDFDLLQCFNCKHVWKQESDAKLGID